VPFQLLRGSEPAPRSSLRQSAWPLKAAMSNRRNAVVVALVDVAARSQQQLQAVGVAVLGGDEIGTAPSLSHLLRRRQQPAAAAGSRRGRNGGNVNRRSAVVARTC